MAHGRCQNFTAVIASAAATSGEVDLGGAFAKVRIDIGGTGATDVGFQAAPPTVAGAGTYRTLRHPIASGVTAPATALVGSACSGSFVEVPALAGHRYIKVVANSAVANGATLQIIASDL